MSELNKDGLVPGQAVDFTTLMQTIRKKTIEAVKDEPSTDKPEPAASRPKKPSVPNVPKAKKQKEA